MDENRADRNQRKFSLCHKIKCQKFKCLKIKCQKKTLKKKIHNFTIYSFKQLVDLTIDKSNQKPKDHMCLL